MNRGFFNAKKFSLLGLTVFPLCLSGSAEAGQFLCSKPASYAYNCGNKDFPFSNFCPSDYKRECGDYQARQQRSALAKRAARQRDRSIEMDKARATSGDVGDDVVALPEPKPKKAPVVAVPADQVAMTPPAKLRGPKVEPAPDDDDVLAPPKNAPAAPAPVSNVPEVKDEPAKAPVAAAPADKPAAPVAAVKPADAPKQEQTATLAPGETVCSKNANEILKGNGKLAILRERLEAVLGERLEAGRPTYTISYTSSSKSCREGVGFALWNETYKPGCAKLDPVLPTVISVNKAKGTMTTVQGPVGYRGTFQMEFCTDGKKLEAKGRALGKSVPGTVVGGMARSIFTPDGDTFKMKTISSERPEYGDGGVEFASGEVLQKKPARAVAAASPGGVD